MTSSLPRVEALVLLPPAVMTRRRLRPRLLTRLRLFLLFLFETRWDL